MSNKDTTGPWKFETPVFANDSVDVRSTKKTGLGDDQHICNTEASNLSLDESIANARLIAVSILLLTTACAPKRGGTASQASQGVCAGQQTGDWSKSTQEHISLTTDCHGHEFTCNQDFVYSVKNQYLAIIPSTIGAVANCFSPSGELCEFQVITDNNGNQGLDIKCPSLKRGYKK